MNLLKLVASKNRYAVLGLLVGLSAIATGAASFLQPTIASAAQSCDKVNIVYCGLDGGSIDSYVSSFKADYASGSNNGHNDLRAVYNWSGANSSSVAGMNTSNTKMGTLYRNGTVVVDGTVVATDSWVTARFTQGSGFVQISNGVWARKTTTSLAEPSHPVIVHFNGNGVADFAVMTTCGNAVKFTPVPPKPKPALSCLGLTGALTDTRTFTFTAKASASNTSITKYVFDFGDNTNKTVTTGSTTATATHTYSADDASFTARVTVYDSAGQNDTNDKCTFTAKTPPVTPGLACVALSQSGDGLTRSFTAVASATNTTINSYTFTYSDGTSNTITTSATTATDTHTFAQNSSNNYTATVAVNGKDQQNVTSPNCQVSFTLPTTPPTTPPVLPNTGAGNVVGMIGAVIVAAGLGHQFFIRKLRGQN